MDFSVIESLNWYSYCSNNPVRYTDPSGMMSEEEYYKNLDKNYMPVDNRDPTESTIIGNILPYIQLDENGVPLTDKNGAAMFNDKGNDILGGNNGWTIEPKDTFHEKDGEPVVKLTHEGGGEQVYDMFSGDLVTDPEFSGTFNVTPPSYDTAGRKIGHYRNDIQPWIKYGGNRGDITTPEQRRVKLNDGKSNPFGSIFRNLPPPTFSTLIYLLKLVGF